MNLESNPTDERFDRMKRAVSQHWLRYCALVVTAVLTGLAGWSYTGNYFFAAALVFLAEGASLFWASRIEDYGNKVQQIAAWAGTVIAWASIAVTDLASVAILAHGANVEVFSMFAKVPEWSQAVAVYVLPTLAVVHGLAATVNYFFSEEARLARELATAKRAAEKSITRANTAARVVIAKAEAAQFEERARLEAPNIGKRKGDAAWTNTLKADNLKAYASEVESNPTPRPKEGET